MASGSPTVSADLSARLETRAAELSAALNDPNHPDHEALQARLRAIEAVIRVRSQPMLDAIEASERITAADLAIVIDAGLRD